MPDLRHFGDQEARCFLTAEQKAEHMKPAQTRTIDGDDAASTTGAAHAATAGAADAHGATKVGD